MKIEQCTNNKVTTITITKDTKGWLLQYAKYGDSMDKLVRRLLASYDKAHHPRIRNSSGQFAKKE